MFPQKQGKGLPLNFSSLAFASLLVEETSVGGSLAQCLPSYLGLNFGPMPLLIK